MKKTIATFLLINVSTAVFAFTPLDSHNQRESVTLDYLMESCSVIGETANGMIPFFDCESYIYGVLDSHAAVRASLKASEQACFPASLAPWQVYKEIESAIPRSQWGKPAAPHLIKLLRKQYPCA